MQDEIDPFEARQAVLEPLLAAQQLLGVLEGAEASGIITRLVSGPASTLELADIAGVDVAIVSAVVAALAASEVVEQRGETGENVALTPPWRALCKPGGFTPFATLVRGNNVAADHLRSLDAVDYWSMPTDDRIALAAMVSPDPIEGGFVAIQHQWLEMGHPFAVATSTAERVLELGCGLAGAALSALQAFPNIRETVGVELSDDVAAEAERRAQVLGLTDRFRVVRCDASDFHDPEPFATAFWSQFFFAESTREAAVATLFDHVRPGGTVGAPCRWFDAAADDDPTGLPARAYALFRVRAQASGVPERSPEQVEAELRAAGFVDTRTLPSGPTQFFVVATRP